MPDLTNSQRRIDRSTYVEIRADANDVKEGKTAMVGRPLEKVNFLRSLHATEEEIARVRSHDQQGKRDNPDHREALAALTVVLEGGAWTNNLRLAGAVAHVRPHVLADLARLLAAVRREMSREARHALEHLHEQRVAHPLSSQPAQPDGGAPRDKVQVGPGSAQARRTRAGGAPSLHLGDATPAAGNGGSVLASSTRPPVTTTEAARPALAAALEWALQRGDPLALQLRERATSRLRRHRFTTPPESDALVASLTDGQQQLGDQTDHAASTFLERFKIEPIGRLHLERMEMTPVGVERGELVYSIPLAPKETVNISHKEWSLRSEEFETLVLDAMEGYSETGVTEKNDLSQSTESQSRHTKAFSLSGTYSGYGASVSVGYNSTSEDAKAQKDSREQSIDQTRKASARTKQEHKHSFKVTSVIGSEDQSVRVITNPSDVKPLRVDYYQLVRKWRVDLYRYGLRMTYDLVVPSPGADLLQQLNEMRELDALIDAPFNFPLTPSGIRRDTWEALNATWGANVDFPPPATDQLNLHDEETYDCGGRGVMRALDFTVDRSYSIGSAAFLCHYATCGDLNDYHFGIVGDRGEHNEQKDTFTSPLSTLVGKSGDLAVAYSARNVSRTAIKLTLDLDLTDEAFAHWQHKAWSAMRNAAEEAFYASRQLYVDRRAALADRIKGWDALTLRKMEREELMKSVLTWLFGPAFELVPADIEDFFDPASADEGATPVLAPTDVPTWTRVIQFGEMIKFLHHAIEWENVLYFTYPYFWDSPLNWDHKRFLQHPDPVHREFLRAGSVRVVLTIRPGYEVSFAEFMETGGLAPGHPYMTIAEEIRDYALTNYEGIPAANPEDPGTDAVVSERERGILIGRWYEYTPTSALDLSLDTDLATLA